MTRPLPSTRPQRFAQPWRKMTEARLKAERKRADERVGIYLAASLIVAGAILIAAGAHLWFGAM